MFTGRVVLQRAKLIGVILKINTVINHKIQLPAAAFLFFKNEIKKSVNFEEGYLNAVLTVT